MCGRYSLKHKQTEIEEFFSVELPDNYQPHYNIAPTQPVLIVRKNHQLSNGPESTFVYWGLIPPWAKDPKIASKMINARCETTADKPGFRTALKRRRCIIPISGFYEWKRVEKSRQPYYIYSADGNPLGLAGLWESWKSPQGEEIQTCCILTTSANAMISEIHDRMPVILPRDSFGEWLATDHQNVSSMISSAPEDMLTMHPVAPLVNNVRNDSAELIERVSLSFAPTSASGNDML